MKMITVRCTGCGIPVEKSQSYLKQARARGYRLFCSHSCAAKTTFAERRKAYTAPLQKECTKCREVKPLMRFGRHPNALDGRQTQCRTCTDARSKEWRIRKPEKAKTIYRKYKYGLTPEMEAAFLTKQKGGCAVCGNPPPLVVDHCHKTKVVRGLLCYRCNLGLGMFGDNIEGLLKAIRYLKQVAAQSKKTSGTKRKSAT
jgi:hypothetical protein